MKIYIDGSQLECRKKMNNILIYTLKDGRELKTKDIDYFEVICDECNIETKLKIYPTTNKTEYLCATCRNKGKRNPMFGKKWTDEFKKRRSEMYKGEKNPMYNISIYDVWCNKYGKDIADKKMQIHREKSSNNSNGSKNGMFSKTFYEQWVKLYGEEIANIKLKVHCEKKSEWLKNHQDHLKKMIINSHKKIYRKTKIEREVENFLIENSVEYKYNFILDKYQYDFLLKKLNTIIEVQGDYWHANPLYYSETDASLKKLNENQKYKISLDLIKNEFIKDKYNIIYLWENEIKNKTYKNKLWNLLK